MTELDAPLTTSSSPAARLPKRPGLWRVVSIIAVAAAVVVTTISVLQARSASDVAIPERSPIALETVPVTVTDLILSESVEVAVLGLPHRESRRAFEIEGTDIELPRGMAAAVALYASNGDIIGLAIVPGGADRGSVELSAQSTARALLTLSPGVLVPDLSDSARNVDVVAQDVAFDKLVDAIRANSNISDSNPDLEIAFAEIADRLPAEGPPPDQGCDSVLDPRAFPAAGACVQPEPTGFLITNEQDRWALLYSAPADWAELCGIIAPVQIDGSAVLVPSEQCQANALLAAPGPIVDQGEGQAAIDVRVRTAAAINLLHSYAGPFSDLVAGSTGYTSASTEHIRQNSADVERSIRRLVESSEEFAAALDVSRQASTAIDRHLSSVVATRLLISESDSTALIPQRIAGDTQHLGVLDFYTRASEYMVASRTAWRWEADAIGFVDFGGGS